MSMSTRHNVARTTNYSVVTDGWEVNVEQTLDDMTDLIQLHATWLRAGGRSIRTINERRRVLTHAEAHLPWGLDQADGDELAGYLARDGLSRWTQHTYFNHLGGYYRWGVAAGHLVLNPMLGLLTPLPGDRIPDPASDDELAAALALLPEQPWRMAVRLAAFAGLRAHEIVSVRREHCTDVVIRIRGKGGRMETAPMAPQLWMWIRDRPAGLLVHDRAGRAIREDTLSASQHRVWVRIGQPHQHLHRFRHWFATALLVRGADIRTVQECLRHRSLSSTQGYTAVVPSQRQAAVALLPVLG
jgi:integrase